MIDITIRNGTRTITTDIGSYADIIEGGVLVDEVLVLLTTIDEGTPVEVRASARPITGTHDTITGATVYHRGTDDVIWTSALTEHHGKRTPQAIAQSLDAEILNAQVRAWLPLLKESEAERRQQAQARHPLGKGRS